MNLICTDGARRSSWNCMSPTASSLYNQTTQCLEHKEHVLLASFGGMRNASAIVKHLKQWKQFQIIHIPI